MGADRGRERDKLCAPAGATWQPPPPHLLHSISNELASVFFSLDLFLCSRELAALNLPPVWQPNMPFRVGQTHPPNPTFRKGGWVFLLGFRRCLVKHFPDHMK